MARHDDSTLQRKQALQRANPLPTVGLANKGDPGAKHQVARDQHFLLRQVNHQVFGCVRRPHRLDHYLHATQPQFALSAEPLIGFHQAGVGVDPRRELLARGPQA